MSQKQLGTSGDPLPQPHRYVTSHDAQGKAIFSDLPEEPEFKFAHEAGFNVLYTTHQTPANFIGDKDISTYLNPPTPVGLSIKNGTVLRMVDIPPGLISPNHRTNSLDYGVVLYGEVELILEDVEKGPKKVMRQGDVSVQRGTMHAWRNTSTTEWARMLYVLVDADPLEIGGSKMGEDLGGMVLPKE